MTVRVLAASLCFAVATALASAQQPAMPWKNKVPESFHINGQISGSAGTGGAASAMDVKMDSYTTDAAHDAFASAFKSGGHDALVAALKKAPKIGEFKMGKIVAAVRWARTQAQPNDARRIVIVTDAPVYFAGAGAVDAKSTKGFDVAVLEFTIDSVGLGKGTMAPAAKVKPGGPNGVEVEDYSGKRIELVTVTRNLVPAK